MIDQSYLQHHGIKGMKWGVRRFQNPDGTLTEAGKSRYKVGSDGKLQRLTRAEKKQMAKERVEASRKKSVEDYISGKPLDFTSRIYARGVIDSFRSASRDEYIKTEEGRKLYKEWSDRVDEYENLMRISYESKNAGSEHLGAHFEAKAKKVRNDELSVAVQKLTQAEGHYTASKIIDKYGERGLERFESDQWFISARNEGESVVDWYVRNNALYWDYN